MMWKEMSVCMVLLVLGSVGPALCQTNSDKFPRIRSVTENVLAAHEDLRHITVSVFNKKSLTKHFSYDQNSQTVQEDRSYRGPYCVGGITRGLTAIMLQRLMKNANFTWETPIQEILGHQLTLPDRYRSDNINLRDIFTMRSGLSGVDIVPVVGAYDRGHLLRKLRYLPVVAGFREKFVYNEVLFTLVDLVIQKVTDMSVEDAFQEHLVTPIFGKDAGQFFWNASLNRELSYSGIVVSASSLCITDYGIDRLLRFLATDGYNYLSTRLLEEADFDELFQGIQSRGGDDPYFRGYPDPGMTSRDQNTLGWIKGRFGVDRAISLGGSFTYHDQSLLVYLPDRQIAVFTSFPGVGDDRDFAAKNLLVNQILLLEVNKYRTATDNREQTEEKYNEMSTFPVRELQSEITMCRGNEDCGIQRPLDEFEGTFRNYAFGDIKVSYNQSGNEKLVMEYGNAEYNLEPARYYNNTFSLVSTTGAYYPTFTSLYRQPVKAMFKAAENDPENRIFSVTVSGFDSNVEPEFSRNPGEPNYEMVDTGEDAECAACSVSVSMWCVLTLTLLACWKA